LGRSFSENEYFTLSRKFGNIFRHQVARGGAADLQKLDMKKEVVLMEAALADARSVGAEQDPSPPQMFKAMLRNGGRPEWMITTICRCCRRTFARWWRSMGDAMRPPTSTIFTAASSTATTA